VGHDGRHEENNRGSHFSIASRIVRRNASLLGNAAFIRDKTGGASANVKRDFHARYAERKAELSRDSSVR
jgi:hypothetical protein